MSVIRSVLVVGALLFSMNTYAAVLFNGFTVVSVMPSGQGLHVQLSPTPAQCVGNWWGNQFLVKKETDNYSGLSATILSAYMSGKRIRAIHYSEVGDGTCSYGNWLSITAFQVLN